MTILSPTQPNRRVLGNVGNSKIHASKWSPPPFASPKFKRPVKPKKFASPLEHFQAVCKTRTGEEDLGLQLWSLDDFEMIDKLGSGGTAQVYRVKERQSGYQVALKVQACQNGNVDHQLGEVDVHMTLSNSLESDNIVRLFDYFYSSEFVGSEEDQQEIEEATKYLYMILEVCPEGSLHEAIDDAEDGMDEKVAAKYLQDALHALAQVHAHDMVHCDIKAANFLISSEHQKVKLADFGMAVHQDDLSVMGGSPVYMAPEHIRAWRNHTSEFDEKVDVYSLGVCLFEMLHGFLPFLVKENDDDEFGDEDDFPVLDLRNLDQMCGEKEEIIMPFLEFDEISDAAQDLVRRMMEPDANKRISVSEALEHAWLIQFG